jgi:hypothetical protein
MVSLWCRSCSVSLHVFLQHPNAVTKQVLEAFLRLWCALCAAHSNVRHYLRQNHGVNLLLQVVHGSSLGETLWERSSKVLALMAMQNMLLGMEWLESCADATRYSVRSCCYGDSLASYLRVGFADS